MNYILKQPKQNLYFKGMVDLLGRTYPSFIGSKSNAFKLTRDEADKIADELNLVVEEI